ncbi:MAG: hypothetical protein RIT28_5026, partial [Pseudomonadota bacterium]
LKDEAPVRVKRAVDHPRALFIGGSSVHQGVPPRPQEWPAVVGELLRAETVNLGSPGLDSNDLVQITREVEALTHAALVVYVGHNDFANAFMRARFAGGGSRALSRLRVALMGLRLFTLLDDRFASRGAGRRQEEAGVPILSAGEKAEILDGLEDNLHTIVALSQERGVKVVLVAPASSVLHPPAEQVCGPERCLNDEFRAAQGLVRRDPKAAADALRAVRDRDWSSIRAPTEVVEVYRRVAQETGARLVEAEAGLPRADGVDLPAERLFLDQLHYSVEGHRALAELVAPAVAEALMQ